MCEEKVFELNPQLMTDSVVIGDFPLTRLLMMNDSQFPWFVLVPKRVNIKEVYQLPKHEQAILWEESSKLSELLMRHFKGDKLNVAAIGNIVSQFHLHHVVRYENDSCWPKPIWGQKPMKAFIQKEIDEIIAKLAPHLSGIGLTLKANY
ncbi:MAG: HIT domain-containing protein [Kangiellaceae bacterium]